MTIINLMLGRERGGLEQSAIDYAEALHMAGIPSMSIIARDGWMSGELKKLGIDARSLTQHGGWDRIAARNLRKMIANLEGEAVICHGNRALSLALLSGTDARIIAVAHNHRNKRFPRAHSGIAITLDARERLIGVGMPAAKVHHLPNMVRVGSLPERTAFRTPPVIGTMGRFVPKKGFEVFIDALAILKKQGVEFQASLGGGGPEENALRQRLALRDLNACVTMPGWVEDKDTWFQGLDVFVLPSHHEPFGIALIEAMGAGIPVISTDTVGPREIIRDGEDGLLFPVADAEALATRLAQVLADPGSAKIMGERGHARVSDQFSQGAFTKRLQSALDTILTGN